MGMLVAGGTWVGLRFYKKVGQIAGRDLCQ